MNFDSESDIIKKYKKSSEFKKIMDEIQQLYNNSLNMALYENLEKEQNLKIFDKISVEGKEKQIILFYGHRIKSFDTKDLEKLYRLYIRSLDEEIRTVIKRYSIVFFNGLCNSNDNFSAFKGIYKTLPIMYYSKLQTIYVINPSLSVKSLDWVAFGMINKLFSRRLEYVNSFEDLAKYKFPKKFNEVLPQQILSFFNQGVAPRPPLQPEVKVAPPLKIKAQSPFDCLVIPLDKHEMSDQRIPQLLKLLVMTLSCNPKFLDLEGIFRKSASIEDEEILVTELYKRNDKYIETVDDGYVIAGVIKKIFTSLTQPIFPFAIYDKIMAINNISPHEQVDFVKILLKMLPQLNYRVILFMCTFLKDKVIRRQAQNKMSNYNCSVVFAPCFMRPKSYELSDLMCSGKLVKILLIIFTRFEQVFGKTADRMEVFRKSAERAAKQQLNQKRASTQSPLRASKEEKSKSPSNSNQQTVD